MDSEFPARDRTVELRQTLVATANLAPYLRPRPSWKLAVAAIVAFAVAGALTGGAVAFASSGNADQSSIDTTVRVEGEQWAAEQDATLIGTPFLRSASSTLIIPLGKAPSGANTIVEAFECIDAGTFSEGIDAKLSSGESCTPSDTYGGGSSGYTVTGAGTHTFTEQSPDAARYTVWLSWAKTPALLPSATEKAELADGVVTRAEQLSAYNSYAGCMAALGYPLGDVPQSQLVPQYALDETAVNSGADNRCYLTQYRGVDEAWQLEVENGTMAVTSLEACLAQSGVTPAATPAARDQQLIGLTTNWGGCEYIG